MKKIYLASISMLVALTAWAQKPAGDPKGGISASMLQEISTAYEGTAADKALRNAMNSTPINVLAASAEKIAMIDTHFSNEVKTVGRTDQKSSGRCWLFTGLNVLRARMIQKHNLGAFTFSQNYLFFYDQLEKANLFLQGIIDAAFPSKTVRWTGSLAIRWATAASSPAFPTW